MNVLQDFLDQKCMHVHVLADAIKCYILATRTLVTSTDQKSIASLYINCYVMPKNCYFLEYYLNVIWQYVCCVYAQNVNHVCCLIKICIFNRSKNKYLCCQLYYLISDEQYDIDLRNPSIALGRKPLDILYVGTKIVIFIALN